MGPSAGLGKKKCLQVRRQTLSDMVPMLGSSAPEPGEVEEGCSTLDLQTDPNGSLLKEGGIIHQAFLCVSVMSVLAKKSDSGQT